MASSEQEEYPTLSKEFDKYFDLYEEIENSDLQTNDKELQVCYVCSICSILGFFI